MDYSFNPIKTALIACRSSPITENSNDHSLNLLNDNFNIESDIVVTEPAWTKNIPVLPSEILDTINKPYPLLTVTESPGSIYLVVITFTPISPATPKTKNKSMYINQNTTISIILHWNQHKTL